MTNSEINIEAMGSMDQKLVEFRRSLYEQDLGVPRELVHKHLSHEQCRREYSECNWEEIYKFGDFKWQKCNFEGIMAAENFNQEVVSISGYRKYGSFLRIGMHLYTLKNYRLQSKFRSLFWRTDGFIDRTLELHKDQNLLGSFFSIYPHNRALARWAEKLSSGQSFGQLSNSEKSIYGNMQKFTKLEKPVMFNGVHQYIFFMPFRETQNEFTDQLSGLLFETLTNI